MGPWNGLEQVLDRLRPPVERPELTDLMVDARALCQALALLDDLGEDGPLPVVLAGGANAGKSTLVNVLAGAPVSAVAPVAGATKHILFAVHASREPLARRLLALLGEHGAMLDEPAQLTQALPRRRVYLSLGAAQTARDLLVVDTPDLTTSDDANRALARRALPVAAVVVWVPTSERYGDAVFGQTYRLLAGLERTVLVAFNKAEPDAVEHMAASWTEWTGAPSPEIFPLPYVPATDEATRREVVSRHAAPLVRRLLDLAATRARLTRRAARATARLAAGIARQVAGRIEEDRGHVAAAARTLEGRFREVVTAYRREYRVVTATQRLASTLREALGEGPIGRLRRLAVDGDEGLAVPPAPEADLVVARAIEQAGSPSLVWGIGRLVRGLGDALARMMGLGGAREGGRPDAVTGACREHVRLARVLLGSEATSLADRRVLRGILGGPIFNAWMQDPREGHPGDLVVGWERLEQLYEEIVGLLCARVEAQGDLFRRMLGQAMRRHVPLATVVATLEGAVGIPPGAASATALALYEMMAAVAQTPELAEARRDFARAKELWFRAGFDHCAASGLARRLRAAGRRDPGPALRAAAADLSSWSAG